MPLRRLAFLAPLVLLAGCHGGAARPDPLDVALIANGHDEAPDSPKALIRTATTDGLVGLDEQGQVIPALADRWIVTEDGLSYIFRLREGNWPGGGTIAGQGAANLLRHMLAGLKGTPLAQDLDAIDEIRAMAGRVVEVRLARPLPQLLQILAQSEFVLQLKGQGSGPMQRHGGGNAMLLVPVNPEDRGQAALRDWQSRARPLKIAIEPAAAAIDAFERGERDVVLGGRVETLPLADTGLGRGTLRLDNVTGLFGLAVETTGGALATPELREAVAMAIDRDKLVGPFGIGGWKTTTRLVVAADRAVGPERWGGLSMAQRQAAAAGRVARGGGATLPPLRIALPAGPGADIIFGRLRDDLAAIGLRTARVAPGAEADLRLIDDVAPHGGRRWFFNRLSCAVRKVCNAAADATVVAAQSETDMARREAELVAADETITAANGFIPLAAPLRWSLVRGGTTGFAANTIGWHPLPPLSLLPR